MIHWHFTILEDIEGKKNRSYPEAPTALIKVSEDDFGTYLSVANLDGDDYVAAYITPSRARELASALIAYADSVERASTTPPPTLRTGDTLPTGETNE